MRPSGHEPVGRRQVNRALVAISGTPLPRRRSRVFTSRLAGRSVSLHAHRAQVARPAVRSARSRWTTCAADQRVPRTHDLAADGALNRMLHAAERAMQMLAHADESKSVWQAEESCRGDFVQG